MVEEPNLVARLLARHPDVQEPEYWLNKQKYMIGRLPAVCDIVVNRKTVSRIHGEIERRGSHYILRNVSRNSIFIAGEPIEGEHILTHGDEIGLATSDSVLKFIDPDPTDIPTELLRFDPKLAVFLLNGQPLDLTPSQFRLLQHLYRNRGQICTRESCARAIWQEEYLPEMETDNLDRALHSLRDRLRRVLSEVDLIKIRRGMGYVLEF